MALCVTACRCFVKRSLESSVRPRYRMEGLQGISPFHFSLHSGCFSCFTTCSTSPCTCPFRHDRKIVKKRLLASSCPSFGSSVFPSIRPSVRMKKLASHWTEFHEISYFRNFRKCVQKIQVSLKPDKNEGYLHEDRNTYISDRIALIPSQNETYFRKSLENSEHTFCVQ